MYHDIAVNKKAYIIPNGVDLDDVYCDPHDYKQDENVILFAADPNREAKNFQLAQAAIYHAGTSDVRLKVVYNVAHEQIIQEINKAQVLLTTSKWEGSPNIIKEAMACNYPIVSTDVGDVKWLFGETPGHYLTSFSPVDVAEMILLALYFSKEFKHTKGRKQLLDLGLDSESISKRIIEIYNSELKQ